MQISIFSVPRLDFSEAVSREKRNDRSGVTQIRAKYSKRQATAKGDYDDMSMRTPRFGNQSTFFIRLCNLMVSSLFLRIRRLRNSTLTENAIAK